MKTSQSFVLKTCSQIQEDYIINKKGSFLILFNFQITPITNGHFKNHIHPKMSLKTVIAIFMIRKKRIKTIIEN